MSTQPRFGFGQVVLHREMLDGRVWLSYPVRVVTDSPGLLAVYLARGTTLSYGAGPFRWGPHPWQQVGDSWLSAGVVQLHRPGAGHAIWVLRDEADREFAGWYVNFQAPFQRGPHGFDTLDHELDLVIPPAGDGYRWKDLASFEERVRDGGFTAAEATAIRREADWLAGELDAGRRWWDQDWASWRPPADWMAAACPS